MARRIDLEGTPDRSAGNDVLWYVRTDAAGEFSGLLKPGVYQITYWAGACRVKNTVITVRVNEDIHLQEVEFNTSKDALGYANIEIEVRDVITGDPVSGAKIVFHRELNTTSGSIYGDRHLVYTHYTDDNGQLTALYHMAKPYCLEISAPGYQTGHFNVVVPLEGDTGIQYCCLMPY